MTATHIYGENESKLDILLRGTDVARILNISRALAYQLIQRGEIPSVRLGRAVRVHPKALEQFIALRQSAGN
jgi:excisionase family DNA binding protein